MKSQLTITLGRKDTINKQHMKIQVQIQCQAKALDQSHRTCMSLRYLEACLVDQVGPRKYVESARLTMANTLPITLG
jgi:ribosomal protein L15E